PLFDQGVALLEKTHASPALMSRALDARASFALGLLGRFDEALALEQKSIELAATAFGPEHPAMAQRWNNIGQAQYQSGRYKEALDSLRSSVSINEKALGPNYLRIVFPLVTTGQVLLAIDHDEEARARLDQAERIQKEAGKNARPDVQVDLEIAYATYLRRHGQTAKALEHATQALSIAEKAYGQKSGLTTAMAHVELSRVAAAGQRSKDAVAEARSALAILEALPSQQPWRLEEALLALGEALLTQGTPNE